MKTFAQLAIGGVVGLVLLKVLVGVLFPIIGLVVGLIALTFRLAIFAAIAYFVYSLFFKKRREAAAD